MTYSPGLNTINSAIAVKIENSSGTIINPSTDGASALNTSKVTVTTAGTRVQLPNTPCVSVVIKALSTNTGIIYVGNSGVSSANGFQLKAGDIVALDINNTNFVYIDSSVNGEGITELNVVSP